MNTVSYSITGGGLTAPLTGTFSVEGPGATFTHLINDVPAGQGYTISLTATATDGVTTGVGSATFNVVARTQTGVSVHLVFRTPNSHNGSVLINGDVNVAPRIDVITALPQVLAVGATSQLAALAVDPDNAPSALSYVWTSSGGGTVTSGASTSTFTATASGTSTVTLVVSDGDATDTHTIQITVSGTGTGSDAGTPPPVDAGQPQLDAGQPTPDAGQPQLDAGQPTPDAGQPTPDAGQPTPDAGQPTPDAGQPTPDAGQPTPDAGSNPLAACTACESVPHDDGTGNLLTSCPDNYNAGLALTGTTAVIAGNSYSGKPRAQIFQDILDCIHTTKCALRTDGNVFVSDCFCGINADPNVCFSQGTYASAAGPCKQQLAAGVESDVIGTISSFFTDPTNAAGAAGSVIEGCDYFSCSAQCL